MEIGVFSKREAMNYLRGRDVRAEPDILQAAYEASGGHPFKLALVTDLILRDLAIDRRHPQGQ